MGLLGSATWEEPSWTEGHSVRRFDGFLILRKYLNPTIMIFKTVEVSIKVSTFSQIFEKLRTVKKIFSNVSKYQIYPEI